MGLKKTLKIPVAIAYYYIMPRYIHHRNLISKGISEINFIRYIGQFSLIAGIAFKYMMERSTEESLWLTVIIAAILLVVCWIIGKVWDITSLYDEEANWNNKRNPFVKNVEKKIGGNDAQNNI